VSEGLELELRARPPQRCPFCHDDLGDPAKGHWTCGACNAVHHASCWGEAGTRCAACGAEEGALSGQPAAPPSDAELESILAAGGHAAVVAALRSAGVPEAACLERAVEVATRVELRRAERGGRLGWVLIAQAAALVVCAVLAAFTEAQAAVIGGALALGAPLPFLLWAGWRDARFGTAFGAVVLNLAGAGIGAALVDALDIRRRRPSGTLVVVALILAGVAFRISRVSGPRRR